MEYRIAILHAPADELYMLQLNKHLAPLIREGIDVWHAGHITPGSDYNIEFREQINNANILLILVSADYLATDDCYSSEIYKAIVSGKTIIITILRACDWERSPIGGRGMLLDKEPISSWSDPDDAWKTIIRGIRRILGDEYTHPLPFLLRAGGRVDRCKPHQYAILEINNQNGPRIVHLEEFNTIGRSDNNNVAIIHPNVSRRHCVIFLDANGFFLHDLHSTHGTFINERQVGVDGLKHGDKIRIGGVETRFLIVD